jgi:hypothetical protein
MNVEIVIARPVLWAEAIPPMVPAGIASSGKNALLAMTRHRGREHAYEQMSLRGGFATKQSSWVVNPEIVSLGKNTGGEEYPHRNDSRSEAALENKKTLRVGETESFHKTLRVVYADKE